MSLSTNVSNLATRIATEVKALRTLVNGNVADLSSLDTTAKSNLVLAINEIKGALDTAATDIAALETEDTAINGKIGTLSSLTTTAKNNLVAAINELQTEINNIDVSGQVAALIDDATTSTSKVWSSSKTSSEISSAVSALVDGAPALLDTLNELAAAIGDDSNYAATMTSALGGKQDKVAGVSDTEIGYLANVTSDIQSQIDGKLATTAALGDLTGVSDYLDVSAGVGDVLTFDGANGWTTSAIASAVVLPATTSIGDVSSTEISYLDGVTSSIQTQLNAKASAANVGDTTVNYVTTFEAGLV
jgi:hypothetical protein